MRHIPLALSGHDVSRLIQEISQDARRRAVLARTHSQAIDILDCALMQLAFLSTVQSEFRSHG